LDWTSASDNTNTAFLVAEKYSKIAKYFNRSTNVLKCPSDRYLSAMQIDVGFTQRVRSYSLCMCMGNPVSFQDSGPWSTIYQPCKKMSDLCYPTPAETFTFLDEHPDSINDPVFFSPETPSSWTDVPASRHNGGASFAFADGHTEVHKWTGSLTAPRAGEVLYLDLDFAPGPGSWTTDPDLGWVVYHSARESATYPVGWPMFR
jgi:prepilin-type processing-associated H-X9-DG protein